MYINKLNMPLQGPDFLGESGVYKPLTVTALLPLPCDVFGGKSAIPDRTSAWCWKGLNLGHTCQMMSVFFRHGPMCLVVCHMPYRQLLVALPVSKTVMCLLSLIAAACQR